MGVTQSTSGNLIGAGPCAKCGNPVFVGLTHHCPTMPQLIGTVVRGPFVMVNKDGRYEPGA